MTRPVDNNHFNLLVQVFTRAELEAVADLCRRHNVICVSDEVYEWLVYSGNEHCRIGTLREWIKHCNKNSIL